MSSRASLPPTERARARGALSPSLGYAPGAAPSGPPAAPSLPTMAHQSLGQAIEGGGRPAGGGGGAGRGGSLGHACQLCGCIGAGPAVHAAPSPPPRAGPSAPHPAPPPPTGGWSMQLQSIKGQGGGSDGAEASHRGRRKGRMRGGRASSRAAARARASRGPPLNLGGTQAAPPSRPRRRARHPPLGQCMGAAKRLHASAGPGNAHQSPYPPTPFSLQNTQPPSPSLPRQLLSSPSPLKK